MNGVELFGRTIVARLDRAQNSVPLLSNSVYVGNLSYHVTPEQLYMAFARYSPISVNIQYTPAGLSKGCATVLLPSNASAEAAIREMNRAAVLGRQIQVTVVFLAQQFSFQFHIAYIYM
jgi:RNA recognition motif-containing protein